MRVLVTGGSGFIGSHVVDRLREQGHEPRILDLVRSRYHPAVEAVIGDLLEPAVVRRALDCCDSVIHLAAVADVNDVFADPSRAAEINARGTAVLLECMRAEGTRRIVYGSTVWVYGNSRPSETLNENSPLAMPTHLYTATKLAGEMYCASYGELYGVEYTIFRFGIPYGPRARPATVLAAFVARALAGQSIAIAGDGRQSRPFVYVEDLADGIVAGLVPHAANRVYNLVGGENVTVREVAETVRAVVAEVPIIYVDGRVGDLAGAEISGERAAAELDWRPGTSLVDGMRRYVEWVSGVASEQSATMSTTAVRDAVR